MNPQLPIFFSKNEGMYYYIDSGQECSTCQKGITDYVFVRTLEFLGQLNTKIFCINCFGRRKMSQLMREQVIKAFVIKDHKTVPDARPVFIRPIETQDARNMSCIDAVSLPSVKTINHATVSMDTPSLEGCSVGAKIDQAHEEERASMLRGPQIIKEIDLISEAEPILPQKKQIEEKSEAARKELENKKNMLEWHSKE